MATSAAYDPDLDALISRLAGPLLAADRAAFRVAAESALVGCSGEGQAYRTLVPLWRSFFHPPPDPRVGAPRGSGRRPSKLIDAEPLGEDSPRCGERDRSRLRA